MPPAKPEPGRDPQMAARTQVLNLVFALTSIVLFLTLGWMISADYNREWKRYQKAFVQMDVTRTKQQREEALSKVDQTKTATLQQKLEQSKQELTQNAAEIKKAEKEVSRLQGVWYGVDQNYRFTKAKIDVAKYRYEEAAHKDAKNAAAENKALKDLERQWEDWRLKLEDVKRQQADAAARLASLEQAKLDSEKLQKELYGERDRLDEKLRKIEPGFATVVRNLPVVDMLNPSLKVQQILPANLNDDVIFSATQKVDRCTTCHLGIDKKGFEDKPQPYTTHPNLELYLAGPHPIDKIGCTVCHQGRGRATGFVNAVHVPSTPDDEKKWGHYTHSPK